MISFFSGVNILIRQPEPEFVIVKRSWKRRFFTLPWEPLRKTDRIDYPDAVKRNKNIHMLGDKWFVTPQQYEELKKQTVSIA
jgi:hypothetical protein